MNDKCIIDYVFDALEFAGINNIFLVTNYKEDQIISHVNTGLARKFNITFCHQKKILGSADAVQAVSPLLEKTLDSGRPLLISATDYVMPRTHIKNLAKNHTSNKADITISLVANPGKKIKHSSLAVLKNDYHLKYIIEKPDENNLNGEIFSASLVYIVPPRIMQYLDETESSKRGEFELPETINRMITDGFSAKGYVQSKMLDADEFFAKDGQ